MCRVDKNKDQLFWYEEIRLTPFSKEYVVDLVRDCCGWRYHQSSATTFSIKSSMLQCKTVESEMRYSA